ncbi:MAG: S-layer homology domain-containing protein [Tissierellia bacterium]|nr:S-layer homology domain-containing protein [Tissierellia bacterium]
METKFKDVSPDAWYSKDVKLASDMGLIDGKTVELFAPDDNLTYAEAIKLAACMHQKVNTGSVTLTNGNPWYQSYVDYGKAHSIITSDLDWNAKATRAGYMEIFAKALSNLDPINIVEDGKIPDVSMSHKNSAAIYKLYRAGILKGVDDKYNCNPESNIKRSEVAAILTRMMNKEERVKFTIGKETTTKKELKITKHPVDVKGKANETISFEVDAEGEELKFQWQIKKGDSFEDIKDTALIKGSNTKKISITLPSNISAYSFKGRCVVSDKDGKSVISNEARLIVEVEAEKPITEVLKITKQPESQPYGSEYETSSITFSIGVEGGVKPYTYAWRDGYGGDQPKSVGSNQPSVTVEVHDFMLGMVGDYEIECKVTDAEGNYVVSNTATVTRAAYVPLSIDSQPQSQAFTTDEASLYFDFSVSVKNGRKPYTYEWSESYGQEPYSRIANSNNATIRREVNAQSVDLIGEYQIYCRVTDATKNAIDSKVAKVILNIK